MSLHTVPLSLRAKTIIGVLYVFALFGLYLVLIALSRQNYLYASFTKGGAEAYVGMYGWMMAAAGAAGISSLALFAYRRWRTALFCLVCAIGLIVAAQQGRFPCAQTAAVPDYQCLVTSVVPRAHGSGTRRHISRETQHERMTIAAVVAFSLGCGALMLVMFSWWRAWRSKTWPTVRGEIMHSTVTRYPPRGGRSPGAASWDWHIRYRYSVASRPYEGWRVCFGTSVSMGAACNMVAQFPSASIVNVYHHPERHGTSVLIPGPNRFIYQGFTMVVVLWCVAFGLWLAR